MRTVIGLAIGIALVPPLACLDPTEVEIDISTDGVDCTKPLMTGIALGASNADPASLTVPSATTGACGTHLGNIFVTPRTNDRVLVRVTSALDGTPIDHCLDPTQRQPTDTCVDARRSVAFIRHQKLRVPIVISRACANVMCAPDETCIDGQCTSSSLGCDAGVCDPPKSDAGATKKIVRIAVGGYHACAIVDDGSLWCWGNNMSGQLGLGTHDPGYHFGPQKVPLGDVVDVALGAYHTCATVKTGELYCWGGNGYRQLATDNTKDEPCEQFGSPIGCHSSPLVVPNITGVKSMALGYYHSCVLAGGSVLCWGGNVVGQLGHKSLTDATCVAFGAPTPCQELPMSVPFPKPPLQIVAGQAHMLALQMDQSVLAWGANSSGELGTGMTDVQPHPDPSVVPQVQALALASSAVSAFGCGLSTTGLACWGSNSYSQISPATDGGTVSAPTVRNLMANQFGLGAFHVCTLFGGSVECWGGNSVGQLGHDPAGDPGTATNHFQPSPQPVAGLSNVTQLAVGAFVSCALRADGKLLCWGRCAHGECGHNPVNDPITFSGGYKATWIPTVVNGIAGL